MAKLPITVAADPTEESFGNRPKMATDTNSGTINLTGEGDNAALAAKDFGEAGDILDKQQAQQDNLQIAYASADFINKHNDVMNNLQSVDNPSDIAPTYQQGSADAMNAAAQQISNPAARAKFLSNTSVDIARGGAAVNNIAREKTNSMAAANYDTYSTNLMQTISGAAAAGAPPSAVASNLAATMNVAQASVQAGQMTPLQGQQYMQKTQQAAAETYLQGLKDPKVAMGIINDARASWYNAQGSQDASGNVDLNATAQAAATAHGGAATDIIKTMAIESNFNPKAVNGSSVGIGQFQPGTAKALGIDPTNPQQSVDGIARLNQQNATALMTGLGRPPTPAETYLAYNQGAAGATALLKNPNAQAVDVLAQVYSKSSNPQGAALMAIKENGGDPNMTAAQFAQKQEDRFNAAPTTAPGSVPQSQSAMNASKLPDSWILKSIPAEKIPQLMNQFQAKADQNDYNTGYNNMTKAATPAAVMAAANDPKLTDQAQANLQADAAKMIKQNTTDPMQMSLGNGTAQPIQDFSDPQKAAVAIANRLPIAQVNATNWNTNTNLLSVGEAKAMTTSLQKMPVEAQVAYYGNMAKSLSANPGAYDSVIGQLRPHSPATAVAGNLAANPSQVQTTDSGFFGMGAKQVTGSAAATTILMGEQYFNAMKNTDGESPKKNAIADEVPSDKTILTYMQSEYGNAFANNPQAFNDALETTKAYVAGTIIQNGKITDQLSGGNGTLIKEAMHVAIGNPTSSNGNTIVAPFGISTSNLKDQLHSQTISAIKAAGGTPPDNLGGITYVQTPDPYQYLVMNGSTQYSVKGRPIGRVTIANQQ